MSRLRTPRDQRLQKSRASVQQHLRFAVLIPTIIAIVLSCVVFVLLQWRTTLQDNKQRLRTLAAVMAENSVSSLAFADPVDGSRVLHSLQSEPAVTAATLFDMNGNEFAVYLDGPNVLPLPSSPNPPGIYTRGDRLVIFHPVSEDGREFGTLFLRWDLGPWYAEMRKYTAAAAGILVAALIAAGMIGRVLQRRLSEPILALADTAAVIAHERNYIQYERRCHPLPSWPRWPRPSMRCWTKPRPYRVTSRARLKPADARNCNSA